MEAEPHNSGSAGPNPKRAHFNAGTSQRSSGASFAQTLRAWWFRQTLFSRQADIEATLTIQPGSFAKWTAGVTFPSDPLCDRLYAIAPELVCFSPDGRTAARLEHLQKKGLSRSAILKQQARQYVTPEELVECRADPERAFTIRGDKWIVCLECGQLLKQIRDKGYAAHLLTGHGGMTAKQYRQGPDPAHPRYGKNRRLICKALAAKLRDAARANPNLVPDRARKYLRSPAKGRKMPPEFSRKLADRMRGQRNPEWAKDIPDIEFVWPWAVEEKPIEEVARIVSKCSPDGKFSTGGVWVRLKAIVGLPIRRNVVSEPDAGSVEKAARTLHDNGADDAKLKAEIAKLCDESRKEVAVQNRRGSTGVAILLIAKMRAWQRRNADVLSPAGLARRFLADRAWVSVSLRRKKNVPRRRGPKPMKTAAFVEAARLHSEDRLSWPKIARRLTPGAYTQDPRKAAEAMRQGVLRLRRTQPKT
jgi:hypothetical protein